MIYRLLPRARRRGATLVETAMVLPVFFLILFGIIEYAFYLMILHATDVAAMTGARLAVVSTAETSVTTTTIKDKVKGTMGGTINLVSSGNPTITVSADVTTLNPTGNWQKAAFGDKIRVQVNGTYFFVTPLKIIWKSAPVTTAASMNSEAN